MSDTRNSQSNLPSSQDPMRRKVVGLLAYLTDQWTGFHRATLADMTAEAVYRLVEAGVVELAGNCYLMMPGSPLRMTAEVAVSGRYGDALPQLAIHVPEWFEGQQLRANPNGSFTPDAMRLTAGGVQVRAAVMNPAEQMGVLDQLCGMFIDDELLLAGMVSPGRVSLLGEVDVEGRQQPTVTVAAAAQATNNVVVNVPPIDIAAIVEQLRDAITSAAPPAEPPAAADPAKNGRSENLQPCWIQAHDAYQRAVANESCGETLRAVHDWLHENDPDDYDLPSFDTWAKYVRAYRKATGGTVNHSRRGRTGRSVVEQADI